MREEIDSTIVEWQFRTSEEWFSVVGTVLTIICASFVALYWWSHPDPYISEAEDAYNILENDFSDTWVSLLKEEKLHLSDENRSATLVNYKNDRELVSTGRWTLDPHNQSAHVTVTGNAGAFSKAFVIVEGEIQRFLVPLPLDSSPASGVFVVEYEEEYEPPGNP